MTGGLDDTGVATTARAALGLIIRLAEADDGLTRGCADSSGLEAELVALASPMERAEPGFARVVYFPTGRDQLAGFLARIAFLVLWARQNGYDGPVAWLSFPSGLLGRARIAALRSLMAGLDGMAPVLRPGGPSLAFEGEAACGATVFVGARRPAAWNPAGGPAFATQLGLPLICIPSRSIDAISIGRAPWAGQDHGT